MQQCHHCEGFLPPQNQSQCPHCDAPIKKGLSRPLKRVGQLVLGAGAALTLSACYGAPPPSMPPCDDTKQSETQVSPQSDNDTPPETPKDAPCVSLVVPSDDSVNDSETSETSADAP